MWTAAAMAGGALLSANSASKASKAQTNAENQSLMLAQNAAGADQTGTAASMRLRDLLGLPGNSYRGQDPNQINAQIRSLEQQRDTNRAKYGAADPVFDREIAAARLALQSDPSDYGSLNKQFTVGDFYNDPVTKLGLEFGLNQGTKAINQNAAAGGMRRSGQTLKALTQFGQDYAGSKAGESASRFYGDQDRIFNRLAGVSGNTQAATAQAAAQAPAVMGNIMMSGANARGASAIAQGNAWNNALGNIGGVWNQNQMLRTLMGGSKGGSSSTPYAGNYGWGNV